MLTAQSDFAFNLLQKTGCNCSTVISPLSVSIALDMALIGAKGKTAEEIQNAFAKGTNDVDEIHRYLSNIYQESINSNAIKIANKAYYANNLCLLETYKNGINEYYNGSFQLLDFAKSQEASDKINKFVSDSTDKKIHEIVEAKMFNDLTTVVLINAVSFEKKWAELFEPHPNLMFYSSPDVSKEIAMMENTTAWRYCNTEKYQFVELPYEDNSFSMYILLPHERYGLSTILKNVEISEILNLILTSERKLGKVVIPEFNIESSFNLRRILKELNINDAFNEAAADFSGVCDKDIFISEIIHKAVIEVDKEGTKAVAATVTLFYECSGLIVTTKLFEFVADHPFLYFIADKQKNIYFIGTFFN